MFATGNWLLAAERRIIGNGGRISGSPTGALAVPFARCSRRQIRFEPFEYAFTVPLGGGAGPGIVIRFAAAVMPTLGSPAGATPISIRKAAGRRAKSGRMRHQLALTESKFRKEQPPNTHRLKVDTIPNLVNSFSTRSGETAAISIMLARHGKWLHDEMPTTAVGVIASLL